MTRSREKAAPSAFAERFAGGYFVDFDLKRGQLESIRLVPIMWSVGAGPGVMKRIAAPMVGGLATSFALELLVYPAVYMLWKERSLPKPDPVTSVPASDPTPVPA